MPINFDRINVEIKRKRIPLKKILHGKEIREAMADLEKFRQQFNEEEFFYGAKVYLTFENGEAMAIVRRPETDTEYDKRIDILKKKELDKIEKEQLRELIEIDRLEKIRKETAAREVRKRTENIEIVKAMARELGLTAEDIINIVS